MLCSRLNDDTVVLSSGPEPVFKTLFLFQLSYFISFACINNQRILNSMHSVVGEDKINSNHDY